MSLSVWQRWLKQSFPSARRPARKNRPSSHCRLRVEALEDRAVPNNTPIINDQTFTLAENSPVGTVIGTVQATDPDPGQHLTYSVIGINPGDSFALDPDTGQLTVANNSLLDFESHPSFTLMMETDRPNALRWAILSCRNGGTVSVPGVYGGVLDLVPFGSLMNRSLTIKTGQTHIQRYWKPLLERVRKGEIDPSFVVTHRAPLDQAPRMYRMFREKQDDCVKVVLKP